MVCTRAVVRALAALMLLVSGCYLPIIGAPANERDARRERETARSDAHGRDADVGNAATARTDADPEACAAAMPMACACRCDCAGRSTGSR
jgi:hypothetical protein